MFGPLKTSKKFLRFLLSIKQNRDSVLLKLEVTAKIIGQNLNVFLLTENVLASQTTNIWYCFKEGVFDYLPNGWTVLKFQTRKNL